MKGILTMVAVDKDKFRATLILLAIRGAKACNAAMFKIVEITRTLENQQKMQKWFGRALEFLWKHFLFLNRKYPPCPFSMIS